MTAEREAIVAWGQALIAVQAAEPFDFDSLIAAGHRSGNLAMVEKLVAFAQRLERQANAAETSQERLIIIGVASQILDLCKSELEPA